MRKAEEAKKKAAEAAKAEDAATPGEERMA